MQAVGERSVRGERQEKRAERATRRARAGGQTRHVTPAKSARATHACSVATTISRIKVEAISPMFCDGAETARPALVSSTGGRGSPRRRIALRTMTTCAPELPISAEPCCSMKSCARQAARM